jgi:phosphoribosylformylglycinamidine synthase
MARNESLHEIRVAQKENDVRGEAVFNEVRRTMDIPGLTEVRTAHVYRVEGATNDEATRLAETVFCEPLDQVYALDGALLPESGEVIEIAYHPGVMNPEAASIMKAARDVGVMLDAADSSIEYGFYGDLTTDDAQSIVERLLMNKTVERVVTERPETLRITGMPGVVERVPIRDATPGELLALSRDALFLNEEEMLAIKDYFNELERDPTDCELEIIAAAWSEHCGHKTFKSAVVIDGVEKPPLFQRITETARQYFGDEVLSAFQDNAGVMRFYEGWAINGKVETHNSPSAIEPYGGAMTGSGGVFRDVMGTGQGAKVIGSTDMFCFAPVTIDPAELPEGTLHPDYLQRRVVAGVRDYGNRMGIPTNNGSIHYHPNFRAKPSVIVGAYGILPEERAQKGTPAVNDLVVVIGGRTGRDGIHGATFSSGEMTERTTAVNASAVQIGNAIEEKRVLDAILEARDNDLIRAITDCGAAGFSSAIGEMGEESGVRVDISKAPLKYPGLAPWEIWLSESQERMVTAIAPETIDTFLAICQKYNVEATVLGQFEDSGKLTVLYGEQVVADLDYAFLKHGLPERRMKGHWEPSVTYEAEPDAPTDWIEAVKAVLAHGNVCSKEPIVRQYDHTVQGTSVVPPYSGVEFDGPNDAAVITPLLGKPYALITAHGMNPVLNEMDPYWGSVWAVAEAMANYVAVGGDPDQAVLINNYIWPFPDAAAMGSLDRSVDAVVDSMQALKRPVISGKDSLSSTYRGKDGEIITIPPVLCMSVFGKIPDAEQTVTAGLKREGSRLYLIGKSDPALGGSTYYDTLGVRGNALPRVDLEVLPAVLRGVHEAIQSGAVFSCHDVSEGGVISAVSEMAFGGGLGVEVSLEETERPEAVLFNETAGTFIVEVADEETADKLFQALPHRMIGKTTGEQNIRVAVGGEELFATTTEELKQAWQQPIRRIFA